MFARSFQYVTDHPLSLLLFLGIAVVGYLLGVVVYRLTLHPLAKYPGPLLGRITGWYSVYQAWTGKRHLDFYKLHQQYGDVIRYGPNNISFNSNVALQTIYGFKSNVQKANFYSAFPASKGAWSTHSAIDKGLHARKRRVLSQAFSDSAMRGLQPHILNVIRTFCDAIGDVSTPSYSDEKKSSGWSSPKNMALWANYMSYDVLGDICYGQSFDTLERPDNRFAISMVAQSSAFHYLNAQMPRLKKLGLDRILFRELRVVRQRFMAYSRARLQQRMKLGTDNDRRDFFYYLLKAKDPETGQGFATQELWGESNVLLIAGSDTTSTAFSASFYYLLKNPEYLAQLTKLVRSSFSSLEDIVAGPTLNNLRLLRACIDESMRLSPPVPSLLPREVLEGGLEICGENFPAGTVVGVPAYTIHHNPAYFPDPFSYKPERWIVADDGNDGNDEEDTATTTTTTTTTIIPGGQNKALQSAEAVKTAQSAYCPFSIGPRGCIGKGVAWLELSVALARTVWLYDMRLSAAVPGSRESGGKDSNGNYALKDVFVAEKEGPIVEFRRRDT